MRAYLKNNRQAPRKVRLMARAFVGKNVTTALSELSYMPHKASAVLKKLISSAVANAKQKDAGRTDEHLVIKNIVVDKGITYTRFMPRAFGRAAPIRRECSHIEVTLSDAEPRTNKNTKVVTKKDQAKNVDAAKAPTAKKTKKDPETDTEK